MRSELWVIMVIAFLSLAACNAEERKERRRLQGAAMRIMATEIEQYYVDNNVYPTPRAMRVYVKTEKERERLKAAKGWLLGAIDYGSLTGGDASTTVVKTRNLPKGAEVPLHDEFAPVEGLPFAYYADAGGWILWSPGPDGIYDVDGSVVFDSSTTESAEILARKSFDPSNGTTSSGDVLKWNSLLQ